MNLTEFMDTMWGVDASGVEDTPILRNSYYLQEQLAKKLISEGKITNPSKTKKWNLSKLAR